MVTVGSVTSPEVPNCTASCTAGRSGRHLAARLQAELGHRGDQLVGDGAERPGQVAVGAGLVQVVQDRQQPEHHARLRRRRLGLPVLVDPAPVIGVLGGDPLQVGGAFGRLRRARFSSAADRSRFNGCAGLFGSPGLPAGPGPVEGARPGLRAGRTSWPAGAGRPAGRRRWSDRPVGCPGSPAPRRFPWGGVAGSAHFLSPSSTISASTISSCARRTSRSLVRRRRRSALPRRPDSWA